MPVGPERHTGQLAQARSEPYSMPPAPAPPGVPPPVPPPMPPAGMPPAGMPPMAHMAAAPAPPAAPGASMDRATQAALEAAAAAAQAAAARAAAMTAATAMQTLLPQAQGKATMPAGAPGQVFVKCSQTSNPKGVAGKIAHTCREGEAPAVLTIGAGCINQAVKAVSIARGYLHRDGFDLSFQTAFREGAQADKPSVALYLAKHQGVPVPVPTEIEMSVSAGSNPTVVAGAIAARIREGKVPALSGIGVDAVANCVLALGHTRLYLEPDGMDIRARPEFVHVQKNGAELNALKFNLEVDRI